MWDCHARAFQEIVNLDAMGNEDWWEQSCLLCRLPRVSLRLIYFSRYHEGQQVAAIAHRVGPALISYTIHVRTGVTSTLVFHGLDVVAAAHGCGNKDPPIMMQEAGHLLRPREKAYAGLQVPIPRASNSW